MCLRVDGEAVVCGDEDIVLDWRIAVDELFKGMLLLRVDNATNVGNGIIDPDAVNGAGSNVWSLLGKGAVEDSDGERQ